MKRAASDRIERWLCSSRILQASRPSLRAYHHKSLCLCSAAIFRLGVLYCLQCMHCLLCMYFQCTHAYCMHKHACTVIAKANMHTVNHTSCNYLLFLSAFVHHRLFMLPHYWQNVTFCDLFGPCYGWHEQRGKPDSLSSLQPKEMSKIVDQHGGIVVEFIGALGIRVPTTLRRTSAPVADWGDAILCIYGAPVVNDKHATVAVMAAVVLTCF